MDKRSILFIILVTLSLYFVHSFFLSPKPKQENLVEKSIAISPANSDSLPLAELYSDASGDTFYSLAVISQKSLLTFAWTDEMPKKVFYRKRGSNNPLQEMTLQQKSIAMNGPVIYQDKAHQLEEKSLPITGTFVLQLVSFNKDLTYPSVSVGENIEGAFSLASTAPNSNAFALVETKNGYYPVGVYVQEEQTLTSLQNFLGFKELLVRAPLYPTADKKITDQQFYVINTPYQQLVFTNFGGALAEINLPFQSEKDPQSVVKPTEIDYTLQANQRAHFPGPGKYFLPTQNPSGPYTVAQQQELGGYYPLLRRQEADHLSPKYYALNVVSEYPEVAELVYQVTYFDSTRIVFEAKQNHRRIIKTFSLPDNVDAAPYCVDVSIQVDGDNRGLWITSGVPDAELVSGSPTPHLSYRMMHNNKGEIEKLSLPKATTNVSSISPDWVSNSNGFFTLILSPLSEIKPGIKAEKITGNTLPSRLTYVRHDNRDFKAVDLPAYELFLPLAQNNEPMQFRFYAGPLDNATLRLVDRTYTDPLTGYSPDYVKAQTYHGFFSFISEPFAKILFIIMNFFYELTHSWAFSIILLTVVLRLMLYPLNAWSIKSMRRMQKITPEVAKIQAKHKKDPKKAQLEIMTLYRSRGVNPFSGCLPVLIQMPFLVGMFDLLKSTFVLRGASFIPGWINNLTAPDVLFSWKTPIFLIGNQFHLLPILLGLVMFLQQKISSTMPKDKTLLTDQQKQQRFMGYLMVVVFTVMFYKLPSGLNIYWLSSMLLGVVQQLVTNKFLDRKGDGQIVTKKSSKIVNIKE